MNLPVDILNKTFSTYELRNKILQGETGVDSATIVLPLIYDTDIDLSALNYKIRGTYAANPTSVSLANLSKSVDEEAVTLTWDITNDFTDSSGEMILILVGSDAEGNIVFKLNGGSISIKKDASETATETITPSLAEQYAAQIEQGLIEIGAAVDDCEAGETAREDAESLRDGAEQDRETAEGLRVEAETARENAEGLRDAAEQTRDSAEGLRISAESARATFEAYNASTSYILGNKVSYGGSSYIWTSETSSIAGTTPPDTGWLLIASRGTDGADGVSGVYVGTDPIPSGYNIQIDPDSDATDVVYQFDVMPNASADYAGTTALFTGATGTYKNGGTYICTSSGGATPTYSWAQIGSDLHAHSNKTALDAVSGTNTGDQVLPTRDSLGLDTDDNVTFANLSGTNTGDQDVDGAISTHNADASAHGSTFVHSSGNETKTGGLELTNGLFASGYNQSAIPADKNGLASFWNTQSPIGGVSGGIGRISSLIKSVANVITYKALAIGAYLSGSDAFALLLNADGSAKFGNGLDMNSKKITGLATPTASTDAATKCYVDVRIDPIDVQESSVNLFDKLSADNVSGYYLNTNNGNPVSDSRYLYSHLIPVANGATYTFPIYYSTFGSSNSQRVPLFDNSGTFLAYGQGSLDTGNKYCTITINNASAAYVRVNIKKIDSTFMFVNGSSIPTAYVDYLNRKALPYTKMSATTILKLNPLYRKSIVFDGDSFCNGSSAGASDGGWAKRIGTKNDMLYYNFGVGGATITKGTTASHQITDYYTNYPTKPDFLIIEGGVNDADLIGSILGGGMPANFGTYDLTTYSGPYDNTKFCGAVESLFLALTTNFKGSKIGFIIAHKNGQSAGGYTKDVNNRRAYFDVLITLCVKWGIPYLNLWDACYLNPMNPAHFTNGQTYLYTDGQHLTANGYDYISTIIEAWIKTL